MSQLHVKLASVKYIGNVGSQWNFTISVGGETLRINPKIRNGQNKTINKTVYLKETQGGEASLPIIVVAIEKDKYDDYGVGSGQFEIVSDSSEQEYTVTVQVTEDRGPKSKQKKPATGKLQFRFVYTPSEEDPDCMETGFFSPTVDVEESLTYAQMRSIEKKDNEKLYGVTLISTRDMHIDTCVYQAGNDWKLRPTAAHVTIRWGVNSPRFKEIFIGQSVTCKNIKDAISDVAYRISTVSSTILFEVTPDGFSYSFGKPPANRKPWYARDPIAQHEMVHIMDTKEQIERSWQEIYYAINAHILGSVDQMSKTAAEKAAKAFIEDQYIAWFDLFGPKRPHKPAYLAEAEAASRIFAQLANYAVANKCNIL